MALARRDGPHRVTWLLLVALAGTVLTGLSLVRGGPAAAEPTSPDRYYVVGKPINGQREYLFDIARKTLGNGNRYKEIVELNKGRRQPDGGELVDAMEIRQGWILELPSDATGTGVLATPPPGATDDAPAERRTGQSMERAGDGVVSLTRIGVFALAVLIIVAGLAMLRAGSPPRPPVAGPPAVPAGAPGDPYRPDVPPAPPSEPGPAVRRRTIERIDRAVLAAARPGGASAQDAMPPAPASPDPEAATASPDPEAATASPDPEVATASPDPEVATVSSDPEAATAEHDEETAAPSTSSTGITTLGQPWKRGRSAPPVASSARADAAAGGSARTTGADAGEPSASGGQRPTV